MGLGVMPVLAQIGVGVTDPKGALDLQKPTSTMGLVYPRVALTSTIVESPVVNPAGGALIVGTAVYNTNISRTGANDVHTGIYCWDGFEWKPQFLREEYVKFTQTGGCQRTTINESYGDPEPSVAVDIAGLDNQVFTPSYSGIYRVEIKTNFAAGKIADFTSLDALSLATSEGAFFFSMSGGAGGAVIDIDPTSSSYDYTEGWSYTHSYSVENDIESPAIESSEIGHFATLEYYLYLLEGYTYDFNLSHMLYTGHSYFAGNGDTGDGQGHVGHDIPCSIEFQFIGE